MQPVAIALQLMGIGPWNRTDLNAVLRGTSRTATRRSYSATAMRRFLAPVFSRVPISASAATASDDEEGAFGDREDEGSEIERTEVDLLLSRARTISM